MKQEEIIVEDITEIETETTIRTYYITYKEKGFTIEEKIIKSNDTETTDNIFKVVGSGTKEENEKVISWIEDNYDKVNLGCVK